MYSSAPYWFAALLVLSLLGFWPSYFSPGASRATFAQHFHAVMMLVWVVLLIVQPWLIRTRRRDIHRAIGRVSLLLAPLIVISALYVVHDNLAHKSQPFPPISLSFFWLGLSSAFYFAMLYTLAIVNRRDMQLHARYMAATALTFIVPGLGRLMTRAGQALDLDFLNFMIALWVPAIVGAVMIFHDKRKGRIRLPWVLATVGWLAIVLGFFFLPRFEWFGAVADCYLGLL